MKQSGYVANSLEGSSKRRVKESREEIPVIQAEVRKSWLDLSNGNRINRYERIIEN